VEANSFLAKFRHGQAGGNLELRRTHKELTKIVDLAEKRGAVRQVRRDAENQLLVVPSALNEQGPSCGKLSGKQERILWTRKS
jgi:hypothetical protein